ncbi:MAG: glycosyltransferase [Ruminococcus sp.]|nr:glycosyltransferase [Ruminococcus sp.]
MFFSIIVPMYNVEKYIGECIESLQSQSMKDFELIVVDDGSEDKSAQIVRSFAEKDSRVVLLKKENGGQSTARNFGLRHAKGEFVIFIDSDDFITRDDYLQTLFDKIQKTDADVVMYRYNKFYENRNPQLEKCGYSFFGVTDITEPSRLIPMLVQRDAYYGSAWTKTVRRSLLLKNNIEFDEELRCEDIDWSYRIMEKAKRIACVDKEFLAYRQREGSVTKVCTLKNAEDFLFTLEKYKKRYESSETEIDENLRKGLLSSLAKYYANLFLSYGRVKNKEKKYLKKRMKAISSLLDYADSYRPLLVRKFYRVFGFSVTLKTMCLLDRIKN